SWAWSVMPTVTRPSSARRAHSWDLAYFRSAGTFMFFSCLFVLNQNFSVAHEGRLDHRRLQALVADLDLDRVADGAGGRQARQGDRAVHGRREGAAGDLAFALGGKDFLVGAQH